MGECNCCNKCQNFLVIILLALNTFFLGSIWCSVSRAHYGATKGVCPISGKMMVSDPSKMMCPLTKPMMDATPAESQAGQ